MGLLSEKKAPGEEEHSLSWELPDPFENDGSDVLGHVDLSFLMNHQIDQLEEEFAGEEEEPLDTRVPSSDSGKKEESLTNEALHEEFLGLIGDNTSDAATVPEEIEPTVLTDTSPDVDFLPPEIEEPASFTKDFPVQDSGSDLSPPDAAAPSPPATGDARTVIRGNFSTADYHSRGKRSRFSGITGVTCHVGVDIGSDTVKYVAIRKKRGQIQVVAFGVAKNPLGEDATPEDVAHFLLDDLQFKERFSGGRISWVVSGPDVGVRRKTMPELSKKMLREAIFWSAKKEFGFEDAAVVIDFKVLGHVEKKGTPQADLLVLGAKEEVVKPLAKLLLKKRILPTRIRPLAVVLWKAFMKSPAFSNEGSQVVIDIGHSKTTLAFVHDGILEFTREIPTGGKDITEALMNTIFYQGEPYQFDRNEAEWLKHTYGFPEENLEDTTEQGVPVKEYAVLIRPILERLGNEIQRSIDYYRENFDVQQVDAAYFTGGTARLKNLIPFLSELVDCQLRLLPQPESLPHRLPPEEAEIFYERYHEFAIAYSIAGDCEKSLNLLPKSFQMLEKLRLAKRISAYAAVIALLVIGMVSGISYLRSASLENQFRLLQLEYQKLAPRKERFDRLRSRQAYLQKKREIYSRELILDNPLPQIMKAIANLFPRGMALTKMEILRPGEGETRIERKPRKKEKKAGNEPSGGREIFLSGVCNHPRPDAGITIANYMLELRKTGLFRSVVLERQYFLEEADQLRFEIRIQLGE